MIFPQPRSFYTCSSLIIRIFPNGPTFFIPVVVVVGGRVPKPPLPDYFPSCVRMSSCAQRPLYTRHGHGLMDTSNGIGVYFILFFFFVFERWFVCSLQTSFGPLWLSMLSNRRKTPTTIAAIAYTDSRVELRRWVVLQTKRACPGRERRTMGACGCDAAKIGKRRV